MARKPSCYLHLSFLLHFSAFSALMAGYCTPNWTLVKMSTGDVRALGVVVSCDHQGCEMLNVSRARMIFIMVFGMCTGTVVLAFFLTQAFCLALCNQSCKDKNVGTGLSYLSVFIVFCLGATLTLYHIDLAAERKPDVMSMKIGWSQYSVVSAGGGFLLGAVLNVADFVRRNRLNKMDLVKKIDARSKMISTLEKNRLAQATRTTAGGSGIGSGGGGGGGGSGGGGGVGGGGGGGSSGGGNGPGHFKGKRLSVTVDAAMNMAATKCKLQKQLAPERVGGANAGSNSRNVILVNEAAGPKSIEKLSKKVSNSRRLKQKQPEQEKNSEVFDDDSKDSDDDIRKRAAQEAMRKSKLTKTGHVDSVDGRQLVLPSVEEEEAVVTDSTPRLDTTRTQRTPLNRQATRTLVVSEAYPEKLQASGIQCPKTETTGRCLKDLERKPVRTDSESDAATKYIVRSNECKDKIEKSAQEHSRELSVGASDTAEKSRERRGSAVEDALACVSSLLDTMANSGTCALDESAKSSKTGKSRLKKDGSEFTIKRLDRNSSQISVESISGKPKLPPVSQRGTVVDDSVGLTRSNIKRQSTEESDKVPETSDKKNPSVKSSRDKEIEDMNSAKQKGLGPSSENELKGNGDAVVKHATLQHQMTEEQIKRSQIVENMTKNKEKRKKRITQ